VLVLAGASRLGQAQDRVPKHAQHYALENYATYATTQLSAEEEKGFQAGFLKGQELARKYIGPNPVASKRYRNGSAKYREGFLRGFSAGYHQAKDFNHRQLSR
jgi:hypothetical protein